MDVERDSTAETTQMKREPRELSATKPRRIEDALNPTKVKKVTE